MATFITGVVTNKGREVFAKAFGNIAPYPQTRAYKFRIGMGGWELNALLAKIPKTPNPSLVNVEATNVPGDIYIEKLLVPGDFLFIAPSIMQVRCRLEPLEANDDGLGEPPAFFEIGIFDDNNNMLVYSTFFEQTKTPTKILTSFVQVYF